MPKIEIKSFRKDHYVATTNASQTADYYVFLETFSLTQVLMYPWLV